MELITVSLFMAISWPSAAEETLDLSKHKWKDRVLLVLSDDPEAERLQQQLAEFNAHYDGMVERNLVVYQIHPEQHRIALDSTKFISSEALYNQWKKSEEPFELYLIGLDGGVKLHRTNPLSCRDLFAVIDGMPMRRRELRGK